MSEARRKLTTVFCADVQDYTRLMGADEEGTLATLKRYRDAMGRLIEARDGRVVNTWGDGLIAEFPSAVEAVRAAVDIQNELAGFNAARPADGRMLFRIGLNLGDVIADGGDIYGDDVNIAARLQASAPAGGIVISSTVYDHVRNKVAVGFDFLGALSVKNVEEAVPSYAVRIGKTTARPAPATVDRARTFSAAPNPGRRKRYGMLALTAVALVAINALTWQGKPWSVWPVLVIAVMASLFWLRSQHRIDRRLGKLAIAGVVVAIVNLLTWTGTFWAVWPLLALAVAATWRVLALRP